MPRRHLLPNRSQRGASLVEYALLLAMIAIMCLGALSFLGSSTKKPYNSIGSTINQST